MRFQQNHIRTVSTAQQNQLTKIIEKLFGYPSCTHLVPGERLTGHFSNFMQDESTQLSSVYFYRADKVHQFFNSSTVWSNASLLFRYDRHYVVCDIWQKK